ncbi:MAG TPA: adenosine deaminase [Terriglobales bacterium]|nr:adenosine deaminase [Terriglobales bacterium]
MDASEREQLRRLPKAELHLHLEGSLRPATLWTLAQRHGLPFGLADLAACQRLYQFSDFAGFIHAIKTASQLLRDPADYAAAVTDLLHQLRGQGVVYTEVFLSIGILLWRQVPIEPYWEAVEAARLAAEASTGVRLRWIFDAVRQFGAERFEQVVAWGEKLQSSGSVLAIGIGGDERQRATAEFAPGYARARAAGLRTTIHAGETCGPQSIREALTLLRPDRIGHGLRAFEDPELVEALAQQQVALDVCPTSNLKTGVWPTDRRHPALDYYNRGVKLSISTDDPGIFGCSLLDEYAYLRGPGGFSAAALRQVVQNSFACSLLPGSERRAMGGLPSAAAPDAGGD